MEYHIGDQVTLLLYTQPQHRAGIIEAVHHDYFRVRRFDGQVVDLDETEIGPPEPDTLEV